MQSPKWQVEYDFIGLLKFMWAILTFSGCILSRRLSLLSRSSFFCSRFLLLNCPSAAVLGFISITILATRCLLALVGVLKFESLCLCLLKISVLVSIDITITMLVKLSGSILINLFLFLPVYPLLFCSRSFYLSKVFKVGSAIFVMTTEIENAIWL